MFVAPQRTWMPDAWLRRQELKVPCVPVSPKWYVPENGLSVLWLPDTTLPVPGSRMMPMPTLWIVLPLMTLLLDGPPVCPAAPSQIPNVNSFTAKIGLRLMSLPVIWLEEAP